MNYKRPIVQFSHANGFPAKTYEYIFDQIPEADFRFLNRLGHGQIPFEQDFNNLATELIVTVAEYGQPVIGMGHSLGGVVTILAASRRPDLFEQVILLDPPFFSGWKRLIIKGIQYLGYGDKLGPTERAIVRRTHFATREDALAYWSAKPFFQRFHPKTFRSYVKHGLTYTDEGLELAISRDFEVSVFRTILTDKPEGFKDLKGALIFGNQSELFWKSDARWWRKAAPGMEMISFEGGHLFPLEQPNETVKLLRELL